MKKFEVGKKYLRPGLEIPSFWMEVVERTEDTITLEEVDFPGILIDYPIIHDAAGNELVEVWIYYDEVGYMRA